MTPFAKGGTTDLATMALVCPRDHTRVHTGELKLTPRPGRLPAVTWIEPQHRQRL